MKNISFVSPFPPVTSITLPCFPVFRSFSCFDKQSPGVHFGAVRGASLVRDLNLSGRRGVGQPFRRLRPRRLGVDRLRGKYTLLTVS